MHKRLMAAAGALLLLLTTGCGTQAPQKIGIVIMAGDTAITTVALSKSSESPEDDGDRFRTIMKGRGRDDLPYVPMGTEVTVEFDDQAPDEVELRDFLLREDGTVRYTDREVRTIPVMLDGNQCLFTLDMNWAALLSSNSADYEPGATIRGFRLACSWGGKQREYTFILRTDAGIRIGPDAP